MFFVITYIYHKKTKGPNLMELFTAPEKLSFFKQLKAFDVCTTGDTAHIGTILKSLPHTRQHGCIDILHCCIDRCLQFSEVTWQTYCVRSLLRWSVPLGQRGHVANVLCTSHHCRVILAGTDHCSIEEYRCTHVDACVARTWISYRCVPCYPWCTHRTSLVFKKKNFQFSCGCEQFHEDM
jgi:hypothetical protein